MCDIVITYLYFSDNCTNSVQISWPVRLSSVFIAWKGFEPMTYQLC